MRVRARTAWKELSTLVRSQGYFIADVFLNRTIAIINLDGPDICIVKANYEGLLDALTHFKSLEGKRS